MNLKSKKKSVTEERLRETKPLLMWYQDGHSYKPISGFSIQTSGLLLRDKVMPSFESNKEVRRQNGLSGCAGFETPSLRPLVTSVFSAIFISVSSPSWWPPDGYHNTRHRMMPPDQGIQVLEHVRIAASPYLFRMGISFPSTPLGYSLYLTSQDCVVCSLLEQS